MKHTSLNWETDPVVMAGLLAAFREAFFDDNLEIFPDDTAADVDGWDSLSHVRLLLAIERRFVISLEPAETERLNDVGDLARLIGEKLFKTVQG